MTDKDNDFASGHSPERDNKGYAEIEAAFEKIERLKNLEEEEEDNFEENSPEQSEEDSDHQDIEPEETTDEYVEEEDLRSGSQKKPEKAWKEKKRRFKAQAETRAVLEEKRQILEENAHLKEMLRQAEAAGTYQYSKNARSELEKAKALHKQAVANGDDDALAEAAIAMAEATYNIKELEKWSSYDNAQPQKNQVHEQNITQQQENLEREIIQDWIGTHQELQPNSKSYNPQLAQATSQFVYELESNMLRTGNMDAKYSDDYFEIIDDYINNVKKHLRTEKSQKNIGSIGNVGSVRNSYSSSLHNTAKTQKVVLTTREKEIAKICGMSEEDYIRQKNNISKRAR